MLLTDLTLSWGSLSIGDALDLYSNALDNKSAVNDFWTVLILNILVYVRVSTKNLYIPDKDIIADALLLYSRKNIDYIDAYNAVFMKYNDFTEIYSYDEDFDLIGDIIRVKL